MVVCLLVPLLQAIKITRRGVVITVNYYSASFEWCKIKKVALNSGNKKLGT